MRYAEKIVLNCRTGYRPELVALVAQFAKDGVKFVGVLGPDCARVEDIIDDLCVGDGSQPYFMVTTSHPNERIEEVIEFARGFSIGTGGSEVQVVEF